MIDKDRLELDKWIEGLKRRDAERSHDRHDAFQDMFYNAAIDSGNIALRTAVLINGGAAIAVLSFIAALVGHDEVNIGDLGAAAGSLIWFAGGVAAATLGMGFAYFVNYSSGTLSATRSIVGAPLHSAWAQDEAVVLVHYNLADSSRRVRVSIFSIVYSRNDCSVELD